MRTLVFIFLLNCLGACITPSPKVISQGDAEVNSGISAKLTAIEKKIEVGGNMGLSSRGITLIALAAIAGGVICIIWLRKDSDRRNQRVTERAMLVSRRVKP